MNVIIYACDYSPNFTSCGKETVARCNRAISFIEEQKRENVRIILAAGSLPKNNFPPLKELMRTYVEEKIKQKISSGKLAHRPTILIASGNPWGTWNESLAALELVNPKEKIVIVSSWYHLYRITVIWSLISEYPIILVNAWVWIRNHWYYPFLEVLKFFKVFFKWLKNN